MRFEVRFGDIYSIISSVRFSKEFLLMGCVLMLMMPDCYGFRMLGYSRAE